MNVLKFKDNRIVLIHGDMFDALPQLKPNIAHMFFADFPYGTTQNKWDTPIDLAAFWQQANRIAMLDAPTVCTAQIPFTITLGASNIVNLKYEHIWRKQRGTGHLNAKKQPMKNHENILTFYRAQPTYNPQMRVGKAYTRANGKGSNNYGTQVATLTVNTGRYPLSVIDIDIVPMSATIHPTEKPIELLEYLIKTYTNENDLVIDPCAGSGTTVIACINTNRRCIAIELYPLLDRPIDAKTNPNHFTAMLQRVTDAL